MSTLSIATKGDIPDLLGVINAAYRGDTSRKGWTTEADFLEGDLRTDADDLLELLTRPNAVILSLRDTDESLLGCVFLEKHDNRLYLGMLSVSPMQQAKGVGKQLLKGAEEYAKSVDCQSIYMQVISLREELIDWYLRHGYHQTEKRKPFDGPLKFGVPKIPLEFVVLEKSL